MHRECKGGSENRKTHYGNITNGLKLLIHLRTIFNIVLDMTIQEANIKLELLSNWARNDPSICRKYR